MAIALMKSVSAILFSYYITTILIFTYHLFFIWIPYWNFNHLTSFVIGKAYRSELAWGNNLELEKANFFFHLFAGV